ADPAGGGADAAGEGKAGHAGAAADRAFGDVRGERRAGTVDVVGGNGAGVGQVGVIALPHHRDQRVRRIAALGQHRAVVDHSQRVGAAEVDDVLNDAQLVEIELLGQLAHAVDGRNAGPGRELRRGDDGDAGQL